MSKRFEQALIALIREQGSNADELFKQFVNEHLGVTVEPVIEASEDDMLSGDLDVKPDDTGLTEDQGPMEWHIQDDDDDFRVAQFMTTIDKYTYKVPYARGQTDMSAGSPIGTIHYTTDDEYVIEVSDTVSGILIYYQEDGTYASLKGIREASLAQELITRLISQINGTVNEANDTLLTMKTAPEIHLTSDQMHQAFYLAYDEWRGQRSDNVDNLVKIRTEGKCLAEIHCEMEDQYTLQIFELGGNYYGLTTTINTGENDYYEHLGFDNDAEVQDFINSI